MSSEGSGERGLEQISLSFNKLSAGSPQDVADAINVLNSIWPTAGGDLEALFPELYPNSVPSDKREFNKEYWLTRDDKTQRPVGVVGLSEFQSDKPEHVWLGWFGIVKAMRRRNLGPGMIDFVAKQAAKKGKDSLLVQRSDRPNMLGNEKFYQAQGFSNIVRVDPMGLIHKAPEAADLPHAVIKTVIEINDGFEPISGVTNFIDKLRIGGKLGG